jgi:hypothetical protein
MNPEVRQGVRHQEVCTKPRKFGAHGGKPPRIAVILQIMIVPKASTML